MQKAREYFKCPDRCNKLMQRLRWPGNKIICPGCGSDRISVITTRNVLRCKDCRKQFTSRLGTLFEDSPLELGTWFLCLFIIMQRPKTTCKELADLLNVTLRTAWQIRRKLRAALSLIDRPTCFDDALSAILSVQKQKIIDRLKAQK
jgi:transposase-like protein